MTRSLQISSTILVLRCFLVVTKNVIFAMKLTEMLPGTGRSDIWLIYSRLVIFCSSGLMMNVCPVHCYQYKYSTTYTLYNISASCLIARETYRGTTRETEKLNKLSISVILVSLAWYYNKGDDWKGCTHCPPKAFL